MNVIVEKVEAPLSWFVDSSEVCYLRAALHRHKHPEAVVKAGSVEWCGIEVHSFHVWLEYPGERIIDTGREAWERQLLAFGIPSMAHLMYVPGKGVKDTFGLVEQTSRWGHVTAFDSIDQYVKTYLSMLEAGERLYREVRKSLNRSAARQFVGEEIIKSFRENSV